MYLFAVLPCLECVNRSEFEEDDPDARAEFHLFPSATSAIVAANAYRAKWPVLPTYPLDYELPIIEHHGDWAVVVREISVEYYGDDAKILWDQMDRLAKVLYHWEEGHKSEGCEVFAEATQSLVVLAPMVKT